MDSSHWWWTGPLGKWGLNGLHSRHTCRQITCDIIRFENMYKFNIHFKHCFNRNSRTLTKWCLSRVKLCITLQDIVTRSYYTIAPDSIRRSYVFCSKTCKVLSYNPVLLIRVQHYVTRGHFLSTFSSITVELNLKIDRQITEPVAPTVSLPWKVFTCHLNCEISFDRDRTKSGRNNTFNIIMTCMTSYV